MFVASPPRAPRPTSRRCSPDGRPAGFSPPCQLGLLEPGLHPTVDGLWQLHRGAILATKRLCAEPAWSVHVRISYRNGPRRPRDPEREYSTPSRADCFYYEFLDTDPPGIPKLTDVDHLLGHRIIDFTMHVTSPSASVLWANTARAVATAIVLAEVDPRDVSIAVKRARASSPRAG